MTLFFKKYSYEFLKSIKNEIVSIKLYPQGATTNSDDGVSSLDIDNLKDKIRIKNRSANDYREIKKKIFARQCCSNGL
jgi:dihydroorotase